MAVKLIYIVGMGRSGSTLLERLLGCAAGGLSCGELCFIWERAVLKRTVCACGEWSHECEFWAPLLRELVEELSLSPKSMAHVFHKYCGLSGSARLLRSSVSQPEMLREYQANLRLLYKKIGKESNGRVVIDSSKYPGYGWVLSGTDDIDVRFVHIIRDCRAVAFSWAKEKVYYSKDGEERLMHTHHPAGSVARWYLHNGLAHLLRLEAGGCRLVRVRYEDLVRRPKEMILHITEQLDLDASGISKLRDGAVELRASHQLSGNPARYRQGRVEIEPRDAWKEEFKGKDRRIVDLLSFPLRLAYGYRASGIE